LINTASLSPTDQADYFRVQAAAGAVVTAFTYVGTSGACQPTSNTVLSIWQQPLPSATNESGGCTTAGYLECNDDDGTNPPCSKTAEHTITAQEAGPVIFKVHDYSTVDPIPNYSLYVVMK
jgi:hypothetical protein